VLQGLSSGGPAGEHHVVFTGPEAPAVIGAQFAQLRAAYDTFAATLKKRVEGVVS
jgi:hypothetical protein